jgi:peptidoglycan/xylan/chitin deacetylase (PgdA/CDA1 family)
MADQSRQERREARRRQVRRRRLFAAGGLVLAVLAIAVVVLLAGAGSDSPGSAGKPTAGVSEGSRSDAAAPTAGPVRNATPQSDWQPHSGPVPILEYHVLGSPATGVPYPELYVARPDFHRQLDWLAQNGYEAVTLEQVEAAWFERATLPPKPVVLSFDDGYRPQFTYALPELRRHGWAGVLNLKAEGSDLYPSNVEAMLAAGWELAAHTIHHLDLTELDAARLREEVAGSRRILRREYGVPVRDFCYPAGRFDPAVVAAVEAAGYAGATTEIRGYADRDRPYELARFEILGSTGVSGLAEALGSG